MQFYYLPDHSAGDTGAQTEVGESSVTTAAMQSSYPLFKPNPHVRTLKMDSGNGGNGPLSVIPLSMWPH